MTSPRATNPATPSTPASAGKKTPSSAPAKEGHTSSDYAQKNREQDPLPDSSQEKKSPLVALSHCRFLTKPEDMYLNEPFEMAVDVKRLGASATLAAKFDLYCTRTRDGKPVREKLLIDQAGTPVDAKTDPVVVRAKGQLKNPKDYKIGETVSFELEAHHPQADGICRSDKVEVVLRRASDKPVPWVFYAPGRDQYLVIETDEQDEFAKGLEELESLRKKIQAHRDATDVSTDPHKFAERSKALQTEIKDEFKMDKKPADAIQELLLWSGTKRTGKMAQRIYIGAREIEKRTTKGHWRKSTDATVKKLLDEALKRGKTEPAIKKELETKIKAVLVPGKSIEGQWPLPYNAIKGAGKKDTLAGGFAGDYEVQFLRFTAGYNAEAGFDLAERKLTVGGMAGATYDLAKGKVSGSWSLPGDNGFDLFAALLLSDKARSALAPGAECRFRYTIKAEGFALVGASVAAVADLPCIELKHDKVARVEGKASAYAGASLEGKATACGEWSKGKGAKFETLVGIGGVAAGNAGIGAEVKFVCEVKNGKIKMRAGAMATFGLGGKVGLECELDAKQGVELLCHLFESVEWRRIDAVERLAFDTLVNVNFAALVATYRVAEASVAKMQEFRKWLEGKAKSDVKMTKPKQEIGALATFDPAAFKNKPPEALGRVLQTLMFTFEVADYFSILEVLRSTNDAHKLKWIIRNAQYAVDVGQNPSDREKDDALREGLRRLRGHGESEAREKEQTNRLRDKYLNDLNKLLSKAAI